MRCKFLTVFVIGLIFLFSNISSPFARTVTLSWNPNTENDLAGYKVFVGLASAEYDTFYSVGKVNEYQLDLPSDEDDYYLALKAFDYSGNESGFSAEVVVEGNTGGPSSNPGSAAEYMSLYAAYGRKVSYCSQTSCDGAANCEEDMIPCGGDYPYKYSDTLAGFRDIYDLNDPKILCGREEDGIGTCAPEEVRLPFNLTDLSSSPDAFRVYLPPGTVRAVINFYLYNGEHDIGFVVRYQQPPDCNYCQYARQPSHYDEVPWATSLVRMSDVTQGDVYTENLNGLSKLLTFSSSTPLSVGEAGWLYIKKIPFTTATIRDIVVDIKVNVSAYLDWYNNYAVWDINGDPWSADHGIAAARVCSASDLDACRTEYECVNVGAHWYGGSCNGELACTVDDLYLCDDDRTRCANSGYYWYDGLCNEEAACTVDDLYACDSLARCEGSGFYWDGNSCQAQSPCRRGVLSACTSREDCQAGGGFWYNGECRQSMPMSSGGSGYSGSGSGGSYSSSSSGTSSSGSSSSGSASFSGFGSLFGLQSPCGPDNPGGCDQGACEELGAGYWWYGSCRTGQQIETYDDGRIAEAPVRLGGDADDGTISAGDGMSIHLDVPGNVRTYAVLVFPNDDHLYFIDNNRIITLSVVPVTSGEMLVSNNLCADLEGFSEFMGEWLVAFLTVPASVEPFQSLNDIVDYLNSGGVYHFGSYGVMVGCQ